MMSREKRKIKKIDNVTARQVTFSKRRRGLFKKSEELAVLCEAEVTVIIFSATGKLFEYSSNTCTKDTLERYKIHQSNTNTNTSSLELQVESSSSSVTLSSEVAEELRKIKGQDLKGKNLEELQQLEKMLEIGHTRVIHKKEEKIMGEIKDLENQGDKLMEENKELKQKVRHDEYLKVAVLTSSAMVVECEHGGVSSDSANISGPSRCCCFRYFPSIGASLM